MSEELDEFDMTVLRDFLAEHWGTWVSHSAQRGIDDPEDIYVKLGGERE